MSEATQIPSRIPEELVFDFDIYRDERVTEDVQQSFKFLHEQAPDIFWTPRNGGHWVVTRSDKIREIVMDPEHFSASKMQIPKVEGAPVMIPLNLDPPANLPYRQALMPIFAPKAVKELEDKVRVWAEKIVDEATAGNSCDFVEDVSSLFPVSVFMELMGMPLERLREFRDIADGFFKAQGEEVLQQSIVINTMLMELINDKKLNPDSGLISHLLKQEIDGRPITDDEVLNMCFVLFLGGMDTVTNVSAFTFRELAKRPELQARLADNPDDIPKFVEEGIRCFGVINTPRVVVADFEKFGVPFGGGDMLVNLLPLAGRDDRKNDDPDSFDIDREKKDYLTFSSGPHLCVGHFLARMEIRMLVEEWLKRVPAFRLKENVSHDFRLGTVIAILTVPLEWD